MKTARQPRPVRKPREARLRAAPGQPRAANKARAEYIEPMKALGVPEVPHGDWRFEIKYDGFRALAVLNQGKVELWSRNHRPLGHHFPGVVAQLEKLAVGSAVLDGEIVALDEAGRSRFQLLQGGKGGKAGGPPIVFYVFDLLQLEGVSWLSRPLEERQAQLAKVIGSAAKGVVRRSAVFDVEAEALLAEVAKQGLEGIIGKARGSVYEPGRRSGRWVKCKVNNEQEFVIAGYTRPQGGRPFFGSLLVGYYDHGKLRYAGKVGTGFDYQLLAELYREMNKRKLERCPFVDLPLTRKPRYGQGMTPAAMREVTWVKPEMVAQIRFTEWTNEGSLRHPTFVGLRTDKKARDVVREATTEAA